MLLVLEMDVADLAATRFAISPLCETLKAVRLLGSSNPAAVNRPWVRWARAQVGQRPLRLPRLWPLIATDLPYWPEFLMPAPPGKSPGFNEELARLCATPDAIGAGEPAAGVRGRPVAGERDGPVRAAAGVVRGDSDRTRRMPRPAHRPALGADPRGARGRHLLSRRAAGGRRRPVAVQRPASRPVLVRGQALADRFGDPAGGPAGDARAGRRGADAERAHLAGVVAEKDDEYPDHPGVSGAGRRDGVEAGLDGAAWARAAWRLGTCGRSSRCSARRGPGCSAALRSPATTTMLARRLGVTPSAVSQHLAVLHRGGLVDRQRSGRAVLYQASELGLALLGAADLKVAGLGRQSSGWQS